MKLTLLVLALVLTGCAGSVWGTPMYQAKRVVSAAPTSHAPGVLDRDANECLWSAGRAAYQGRARETAGLSGGAGAFSPIAGLAVAVVDAVGVTAVNASKPRMSEHDETTARYATCLRQRGYAVTVRPGYPSEYPPR